MRILLLTHSFNSLAQRLWCELTARGHALSVEFDINDRVTEEAVALWQPDLVIAPYLKRAIPASVWMCLPCLVVHPGVVGDRGPAALDWAILRGELRWGVTLLQANAEMDAGPIWATRSFAMREASKSSLYRREVSEAALACVLEAIEHWPDYRDGLWQPIPLADWPDAPGHLHRPLTQSDRAIDWRQDDTATVLRKIRSADSAPGLRELILGVPCRLYDARPERSLSGFADAVAAGTAVAQRDDAILLTTRDGAVWVGQVQRLDVATPVKLPAAVALADECAELPQLPSEAGDCRDIDYREVGDGTVGVLSFEYYNGAMSTAKCRRLLAAISMARQRPTRVLLLLGGGEFWSNGIDLKQIEVADSPADESLRNIEAIDDLCAELIGCVDKFVIAAMRGSAGAGGVFLAMAADEVWAHESVILNAHYKNMGNLYGSEYWTYLLPRRMGSDGAAVMQSRLPLTARQAQQLGLIDRVFGGEAAQLHDALLTAAIELAGDERLPDRLRRKAEQRRIDETVRPLAEYRSDELQQMRRNFYGFDPSYHVARWHFVQKTPASWTPRHLARHRDPSLPRSAA